jgi:hypothetical protein
MTGTGPLILLVIDALGWELAEESRFLSNRLTHRRRLRTILGYSSAAIPSLLTGAVPREHGHWFLYLRARTPRDSPFTGARLLARLPGRVADSWSVRRRMAEWWRRRAGIRGYFGLYEVPYRELADLDYIERRDTWAPGNFAGGSFIDDVAAAGADLFVSDWRVPDDQKFAAAILRARTRPADAYLLYLTEIDARQHAHGSRGRPVRERLETYRPLLDELLNLAGKRGTPRLAVVSDHGMTDVTRVIDPRPVLAASRLEEGRDYRVFIDSTFLRFWSPRPGVLDRIAETCGAQPGLRVLEPAELQREGVDFPDDRWGALFVLADPGVLLVPSYMGRSPLAGMHGYTPDDAASDAVLLSEEDPGADVRSILDVRRFWNRLGAGPAGRDS